jgi:NAD(P)-dependent dehydrogenase (short-subunit alcohol dehydrogenase family)
MAPPPVETPRGDEMNKFKNKTAVVTGGASGIGRALCVALGNKGAIVTVADLNQEGARKVAETIVTLGGSATAVRLDVTNKEDVAALLNKQVQLHGRLDYIFNNAGIGNIGDERDKTFDDWKKIIDINLMGVVYGALTAYSIMAEQGSGHIVNTASIAGLTPVATEVAYATTKHAVVGLSHSLRVEGAALGVKVSAICPGVIDTPFFKTAPVLNADKKAFMESLKFLTMKDVDKAAKIILRGVARNKALIVFPFYTRMAWNLYRISPTVMELYMRHRMKLFRELSKKTKA